MAGLQQTWLPVADISAHSYRVPAAPQPEATALQMRCALPGKQEGSADTREGLSVSSLFPMLL